MQIEEKIKQLANYSGEDRVISVSEYIDSIGSVDSVKYNSKLPSLDNFLEGFEEGELTVISAPTGCGKTTFAQTLTENFYDNGFNSLWFSYEMRPVQLIKKFPNLPMFYLPNNLKERTLSWIEDRITESEIKFKTKIVFIDHLHYLIDMLKLGQPSLEIGSIVRQLKRIAVEHEILIFLIAHLKKIKIDEELDNDHLRDSSLIAQEADNVLMLWRLKQKTGEMTNESILKITKARRTGTVGKKIKMSLVNKKFIEMTQFYDN